MSSVSLPRVPPPQTGVSRSRPASLSGGAGRLPSATRLGLERWMQGLLEGEPTELGWARSRHAWLDRLPSAGAMLLSTLLLLGVGGVAALLLLDQASQPSDGASLGVEPTRPSPLHQVDAPWPPLPVPEPPREQAPPEPGERRGVRGLERRRLRQPGPSLRPYHPRRLQDERQGEFMLGR